MDRSYSFGLYVYLLYSIAIVPAKYLLYLDGVLHIPDGSNVLQVAIYIFHIHIFNTKNKRICVQVAIYIFHIHIFNTKNKRICVQARLTLHIIIQFK